jgi:hypothetical protein
MPDWEKDYVRVQDKIENINRQVIDIHLLCPHDIRRHSKTEPWEPRQISWQMKIRFESKSSLVISHLMEQTFDEIAATLPFVPASRTTEAGQHFPSSPSQKISRSDLANDRKSMERKCAESLYLIVKRNRQENQWQFPQGKWLEGESLRQVNFLPFIVSNLSLSLSLSLLSESMIVQLEN